MSNVSIVKHEDIQSGSPKEYELQPTPDGKSALLERIGITPLHGELISLVISYDGDVIRSICTDMTQELAINIAYLGDGSKRFKVEIATTANQAYTAWLDAKVI